ncbi:hypothetical protein FIE12Z_12584 [Fusarium flagelliforme]|uniref:Uncharacterized protein n=1 Tax=Fusarium flagelliforme TaxID=2675880 RepID=A0A395M5M3_9HYPO|nr:hypothetical protein FIE12Z_12584 [Fusarium flagelliforme]
MADNCRYCPTRYPGGSKNPDNVYYYRKWGYTVYRTYYDKESDEAWEMLLYSLEHQTKLAFGGIKNKDYNGDEVHVDPNDIQQLKKFFTIEGREDSSQLEGLDAQGIRDFWHAEELKMQQNVVQIPGQRRRLSSKPDERLAMADSVHHYVLLADEATLKDVANGEFVVKAVSLILPGGNAWPGAWMRIPTGYLLDLWILLCDWPCSTEKALSFRGYEEELHLWVWPGDDNRCDLTGDYSEIRHFPHYNNQTHPNDAVHLPTRLIKKLLIKRDVLRDSNCGDLQIPHPHDSSDEDRPLQCRGLLLARLRKEHASEDVEAAE